MTKRLTYKDGVKKAIKVYEPYVKALEEENGSLTGLAFVHGWRSSKAAFGVECRARITGLKREAEERGEMKE